VPSVVSSVASRTVAGQRPPDGARPASGAAIRTRGLAKSYRDNWTLRVKVGLSPLDLDVERGEIFGLLGPNGAGKTTTLKLLTGLLKPTQGRAWLMDVPAEDVRSRCALGFLPEQPYFYDYLNGVEYLEMVARLSGLAAAEATPQARHWLGRVGLSGRERVLLRKYSKGMLQRLGLAAALVHSPELLILDEPMSGLDPFGRRDVRDLILEQRERGVTVLFSSHILPDVEALCDRVAILLGGRLERVATVGELVSARGGSVEIRCAGAAVVELPHAFATTLRRSERPGETLFTLSDASLLEPVLAWMVESRLSVRAVIPQRGALEEVFLAAAEASANAASAEGVAAAGDTRRSA